MGPSVRQSGWPRGRERRPCQRSRSRNCSRFGSAAFWHSTGCRFPSVSRICGDTQSDVESLHESTVVLGPVADSVLRLVLGVHSRLHAEIVAHGSPTWPGAGPRSPPADDPCTDAVRCVLSSFHDLSRAPVSDSDRRSRPEGGLDPLCTDDPRASRSPSSRVMRRAIGILFRTAHSPALRGASRRRMPMPWPASPPAPTESSWVTTST